MLSLSNSLHQLHLLKPLAGLYDTGYANFIRGSDGHFLTGIKEINFWNNDWIYAFSELCNWKSCAIVIWFVWIAVWFFLVVELIYLAGKNESLVVFSEPKNKFPVVIYGGTPPGGDDDDDEERRRRVRQQWALILAGGWAIYKCCKLGYDYYNVKNKLELMELYKVSYATDFAEYVGLQGQETLALYNDKALFNYAQQIIKANWLPYLDYISSRASAPYKTGCSLAALTQNENANQLLIWYEALGKGYVRPSLSNTGMIMEGWHDQIRELFYNDLKRNGERGRVILKTLNLMRNQP